MIETKYYIYRLEFPEYNIKTGKRDKIFRYIGKTKDLKRRWRELKNGDTKALRHRDWSECKFILEDVGTETNINELMQKYKKMYL